MTVFCFRVFIGVSMLQVAFLVFNFLTHITNEFFVCCNVLIASIRGCFLNFFTEMVVKYYQFVGQSRYTLVFSNLYLFDTSQQMPKLPSYRNQSNETKSSQIMISFPADSFKKYKIRTNPNMCILMYTEIQSDQTRITRNALKSQIFDSFTKSSSGHQ